MLVCVVAICSGGVAGAADISRGEAPDAAFPDATAECVMGTPGAAPEVFKAIGAEQCYRVPPGVTSVHIVAVGARPLLGEGPDPRSGFGATVTADVPVSPGQVLYVEVDIDQERFRTEDRPDDGSRGGGASDVRTCQVPCELTGRRGSDRRLVVAGGGGAGGRESDYYSSAATAVARLAIQGAEPGTGGSSGHNGIDGTDGFTSNAGGGKGGTQTEGGTGGTNGDQFEAGAAGGPGAGGSGPSGEGSISSWSGGGGGSGWFGGGTGGSASYRRGGRWWRRFELRAARSDVRCRHEQPTPGEDLYRTRSVPRLRGGGDHAAA